MRITKLLIRIAPYPSNSNRAQSKISYLVGRHPAPVGSPVDLCPGHLLRTHHVLLPDTETTRHKQHFHTIILLFVSLQVFFFFSPAEEAQLAETSEPNDNIQENKEARILKILQICHMLWPELEIRSGTRMYLQAGTETEIMQLWEICIYLGLRAVLSEKVMQTIIYT